MAVEIFDDGLVALGCLGADFADHAARKLLSANDCYGECHYWMLRSAFARQDKEAVRKFLGDWKSRNRKPVAEVFKFVPGEHYHVLSRKFDTLDDAMNHLRDRGYRYGGLFEKHVYAKEGD